nr:biotin/lipoyl-binding protein [Vibrio variabilis]
MNKVNTLTLCIAASVSLFGCNQSQVLEPPETKQTTLQVIKLNSLEDQSTKHFSGVVRAHENANLAFRVPGTLSDVYVQPGDSVKKGDVIARLDPHDYQLALEELQARCWKQSRLTSSQKLN